MARIRSILTKNYGSVLIVWVGSFQAEIRRPVYGLTTQLETYSVWRIQIHEFVQMLRDVRTARSWRARATKSPERGCCLIVLTAGRAAGDNGPRTPARLVP